MSSVSVFFRPLEVILSLLTGCLVLYGLALAFNVPQKVLDHWLRARLTPGQTLQVGRVSGLFPFSFHVEFLQSGHYSCRGLSVQFLWSQRAFMSHIQEIVVGKNHFEQKPLSDQSLESSLNSLQEAFPKILLLQSLRVDKILLEGPKMEASADLKLDRFQGVRLHICGQSSWGSCRLALKSTLQEPLLRAWDYDLELSDKSHQLHVDGCLRLGKEQWDWKGRVLNSPWPIFRKARWMLQGQPGPLLNLRSTLFSQETMEENPSSTEKILLTCQAELPSRPAFASWKFSLSDHGVLHITCPRIRGKEPFLCRSDTSTDGSRSPLLLEAWTRLAKPLPFDVHLWPGLLPEAHISLQGTYSTDHLRLSTFKGKWKEKPFSVSPVDYNITSKTLQPVTVQWGALTLTTNSWSWDDTKESNRFTLPPCPLHSKEIDFGNLSCEGTVSFTKKHTASSSVLPPSSSWRYSWENKLSFRVQPSEKIERRQSFGWALEGQLVAAPDRVALRSVQLRTGLREPNEACLKVDCEARCVARLADDISPLVQLAKALIQCHLGTYSRQDEQLRRSIQLQGSCQGTLALAALTPFLSVGDRILGTVTTKLNLDGNVQEPELKGTFELKDGYYENIGNGVVLRDVSLQAVGERDGLRIHTVRLTDGTSFSQKHTKERFAINSPPPGFAGGAGRVHFFSDDPARQWAPHLNLDLRCNALQMAYGPMVKARATGNLRLDGPLTGLSEKPVVTGDVVIDAMSITVNTDEMPTGAATKAWTVCDTTGASVSTSDRPPATEGSAPQRFGMNIILRAGHQVVVQNDQLKCYLKGTMVAKGPMTDAYLVGTMEADPQRTNRYNIIGKVMKITKGDVIYDEQHLNDPSLNLLLTISLNGKEIFVQIGGRLSKINISLRSNPVMSQEEILSLLLFRQGRNDLSGQQNLQIKAISTQMLQGGPLKMFDSFCRKARIDVEFVEVQDTASGETKQSVCLRKSLGDKVDVSVEQNIATKNESVMTVTYKTPVGVDLEAKLGTSKELTGIGAQWKKQY